MNISTIDYSFKNQKYRDMFISDEKIIVGRCTLLLSSQSIFLYNLYTVEAYRNIGIATKIIQTIQKERIPITLSVDTDNNKAVLLYKKLGFIITREQDNEVTMVCIPKNNKVCI